MEKKQNKSAVVFNDIFMGLMTLIAIVGFVCVLFVGVFIGVAGLVYLVKSFSFTGGKTIFGGIVMSLLALGTCAIMLFANYMVTKAVVKSWKKYLVERQQALHTPTNNDEQ